VVGGGASVGSRGGGRFGGGVRGRFSIDEYLTPLTVTHFAELIILVSSGPSSSILVSSNLFLLLYPP